MTKPATERQARYRAACKVGLTPIRIIWATPDNKAAILDAKELGEKLIAAELERKANDT